MRDSRSVECRVYRFGNEGVPAEVGCCKLIATPGCRRACVSIHITRRLVTVYCRRQAEVWRVCTYSRCGIRIRPNQIELMGVSLVRMSAQQCVEVPS